MTRRMTIRSGWGAAVLMAAGVVSLSACGDTKELSLCDAYAQLLDQHAELSALDPTAATAAQAQSVAEAYLAGTRRLLQVNDGRYEQELSNLDAAITDVVLTLQSAPTDADYATWQPLVDDDLEAVADAAAQVQQAIEPSCAPSAAATSASTAAPGSTTP